MSKQFFFFLIWQSYFEGKDSRQIYMHMYVYYHTANGLMTCYSA